MAKPKTSLFSTLQKTTEVSSSVNSELVRQIPVEKLVDNPMNRFSMEEDEEFIRSMNSVKEDGFFEDLIVTPAEDGKYRIISGHRRAAIARKLGKTSVPCKVRTYKNELEEARALIGANIHKRAISPLDMAQQLKVLSDVLDRTQGIVGAKERTAQLTEQTGLSTATVERYLSLLQLNESVATLVRSGKIAMSDAYELARKKNLSLQESVISASQNMDESVPMVDRVHAALDQAKQEAPSSVRQRPSNPSVKSAAPSKTVEKYWKSAKKMSAEITALAVDSISDPSLSDKLDEFEKELESLLAACKQLHDQCRKS